MARQAEARWGNQGLEFTGHSLGGEPRHHGSHGHGPARRHLQRGRRQPDVVLTTTGLDRNGARNIDNHTVDGEVLTSLQESTWASDAVGTQHRLPAVRMNRDHDAHGNTITEPNGEQGFTPAPELGIMERVDRHSRYIDGIEQQKTEDIATMRAAQ